MVRCLFILMLIVSGGCAGAHPPSARQLWGHVPDNGVYVAGVPEHTGLTRLKPRDVIQSIDDVAVNNPRHAYEALADGKRHTVVVWRDHDRVETQLKIADLDIRAIGLASAQSLHSVTSEGRGARLGMVPRGNLSTGHTLPTDMWGQNYIVLDFAAGFDIGAVFPPDAVEWIERHVPIPLILLEVVKRGDPSELHSGTSIEHLEGAPRVTLATTYFRRVGRWSNGGYLSGTPYYVYPNLSVVDCHGVVRWQMKHFHVDSFSDGLVKAVEYAAVLEQEREAGACWTPP